MSQLKLVFQIKRNLLENDYIKFLNSLKNNILNYLIIFFNKSFKKYYIPHPRNSIHIETSSLCNLKCKFCAYDKRDLELHPSLTMKIENFKRIVNDCNNEKYRYIGLTPTTGDIFMDKTIFEKLDILENNNQIQGFFFYTNFIPINFEKIQKLLNYKKLKFLGLSIYGHDEKTFINFTNSTSAAYNKLIQNLEELEKNLFYDKMKIKSLSINLRSEKSFLLEKNDSNLSKIIKKILKYENVFYTYTHEYNNWGDLVKKEDIKELNIHFTEQNIKKRGACSLIFAKNIIGANGNVNACACRDANFTLRLGNVYDNKLSDILSKNNKTYTDLIERQSKGDFPEVCKNCDFYTSIHLPKNRRGFTEVPENDLKRIEDCYNIIN